MSYLVIWYEGWTEREQPFSTYDSAMSFIEDTGLDPDEFDLVEDEIFDD
tara:strand:+ start:1107 stop:1253 length:147 start_codon:yes stop_codon:yes gene_type:complete